MAFTVREDMRLQLRQTESEFGVDLRFWVELKPKVAKRFNRTTEVWIFPLSQNSLSSVSYYYGAALLDTGGGRPSLNDLKWHIAKANDRQEPEWDLPWEVQLKGGRVGVMATCQRCHRGVLWDPVAETFDHDDSSDCTFLDDYQEWPSWTA